MASCTHELVSALRARAGRFAHAAALLALALGATPPLPAHADSGAPPFSSAFPHLYYNDMGWLDGNLQVMAQFDVLTTAFWNQEGAFAAKLDSLRLLNPTIQRLAYVNSAGRSFPESVADPNHVVNRLKAALPDGSPWLVRNEFGSSLYFDPNIPDMPLLNLSSRCPRVSGKTWGEFLADFAVSEFLSSGHWEGIFFDNTWGSVSWVNAAIPGSIDLDLDGVADHPDSADAWWAAGMSQMLGRFQAQTGPGVLAWGNGNTREFSYLNGRYFEDFPFREGWSGSMQQAADWQLLGHSPSLLAMVTRSTEGDFKLMRYGVCSALMAGAFSHHLAEDHSWPNPVVYDEYRVNLGQPIGPPVEIGTNIVAEADFETGIPPQLDTGCGTGEASWTENPAYVLDGQGSLLGRPGNGAGIWKLFLCTNADQVPLTASATYTVTFNYRIVSEPPSGGYFFVGARSNVDLNGSNRNALILNAPAGTVGQARGELTLGSYPDYYFLWGIKDGGEIVIDSIRIVTGRGGAFRRDFEDGIAFVNPSSQPITVQVEPGFRRIAGQVDPLTNNGAPVSQVILAPEDGLVLLAQSVPGAPSAPVVPQFLTFPNPVLLSSDSAVEFTGAPVDGSIAIVTPAGRILRVLTAEDRAAAGAWRWDLRSASSSPVAGGVYLAAIRDAERRPLGGVRLTIRR